MRSASTPALSPILEKMARKTSASCRSSPVSGVMMDAGTETVSVEMAKAATFDQAQKIGMSLGRQMSERVEKGQGASHDEKEILVALLSHSDGARGFYVTTLTAPELDNVFALPVDPTLLNAIKQSPDPNAKLLTMNIAMSTATELAHLANGNMDFAKGSALTRGRTRALIDCLSPTFPALKNNLTDLLAAINTPAAAAAGVNAEVEAYRAFLNRWGYDEKMREAIALQIRPFVS